MMRRYVAVAVIAGSMLAGTAKADEESKAIELNNLFQRASAEHQLIMTCASNMPKSRAYSESDWKSRVETALKNVQENSDIDTAALRGYAESASEIDWSMTLEDQQGLCGSELGKSNRFSKMTTLSTINIVRETELILN